MKTKTLDLTFVNYCTEKTEIIRRNNKAKEYSESIKAKSKRSVKDSLLMLVDIICVNVTVLYCFVDAII